MGKLRRLVRDVHASLLMEHGLAGRVSDVPGIVIMKVNGI